MGSSEAAQLAAAAADTAASLADAQAAAATARQRKAAMIQAAEARQNPEHWLPPPTIAATRSIGSVCEYCRATNTAYMDEGD